MRPNLAALCACWLTACYIRSLVGRMKHSGALCAERGSMTNLPCTANNPNFYSPH
jgi:hypothetical protein